MAGTSHPQDTPPELGLIEVLKVLALTQVAADEGISKGIRAEARLKVISQLDLGKVRVLP